MEAGTETGQVTGTKDKDYNLIWFTEQCLSNALRLENYAQDAERDSDSRFDKSRFGRLLFSSGHHHVKEQPVPTPATDPVYFPTVNLLAQGGRLAKAQIFRLHLHGLGTVQHIHCSVEQNCQVLKVHSRPLASTVALYVCWCKIGEQFSCMCGRQEG